MSDMGLYKRVPVDEITPVECVGVYVTRWRSEWGEPTYAFVYANEPSEINALNQRIADLESLLRWRPVTKELPEEDYEDSNLIYDIVILYPNGKPSFIALGYYHDRRWYSNSDEDLDGIWGDDDSQYVTHWKPRIPAPKEVKGE